MFEQSVAEFGYYKTAKIVFSLFEADRLSAESLEAAFDMLFSDFASAYANNSKTIGDFVTFLDNVRWGIV